MLLNYHILLWASFTMYHVVTSEFRFTSTQYRGYLYEGADVTGKVVQLYPPDPTSPFYHDHHQTREQITLSNLFTGVIWRQPRGNVTWIDLSREPYLTAPPHLKILRRRANTHGRRKRIRHRLRDLSAVGPSLKKIEKILRTWRRRRMGENLGAVVRHKIKIIAGDDQNLFKVETVLPLLPISGLGARLPFVWFVVKTRDNELFSINRELRSSYALQIQSIQEYFIVTKDAWNTTNETFGFAPKLKTSVSRCTFHVDILDINEHSPVYEFSAYTLHLNGSTPVNQPLLRIKGFDADANFNSKITFGLSDYYPGLAMSPDGVIYLTSSPRLFYENSKEAFKHFQGKGKISNASRYDLEIKIIAYDLALPAYRKWTSAKLNLIYMEADTIPIIGYSEISVTNLISQSLRYETLNENDKSVSLLNLGELHVNYESMHSICHVQNVSILHNNPDIFQIESINNVQASISHTFSLKTNFQALLSSDLTSFHLSMPSDAEAIVLSIKITFYSTCLVGHGEFRRTNKTIQIDLLQLPCYIQWLFKQINPKFAANHTVTVSPLTPNNVPIFNFGRFLEDFPLASCQMMNYKVVSGNFDGIFSIDRHSGILYIRDEGLEFRLARHLPFNPLNIYKPIDLGIEISNYLGLKKQHPYHRRIIRKCPILEPWLMKSLIYDNLLSTFSAITTSLKIKITNVQRNIFHKSSWIQPQPTKLVYIKINFDVGNSTKLNPYVGVEELFDTAKYLGINTNNQNKFLYSFTILNETFSTNSVSLEPLLSNLICMDNLSGKLYINTTHVSELSPGPLDLTWNIHVPLLLKMSDRDTLNTYNSDILLEVVITSGMNKKSTHKNKSYKTYNDTSAKGFIHFKNGIINLSETLLLDDVSHGILTRHHSNLNPNLNLGSRGDLAATKYKLDSNSPEFFLNMTPLYNFSNVWLDLYERIIYARFMFYISSGNEDSCFAVFEKEGMKYLTVTKQNCLPVLRSNARTIGLRVVDKFDNQIEDLICRIHPKHLNFSMSLPTLTNTTKEKNMNTEDYIFTLGYYEAHKMVKPSPNFLLTNLSIKIYKLKDLNPGYIFQVNRVLAIERFRHYIPSDVVQVFAFPDSFDDIKSEELSFLLAYLTVVKPIHNTIVSIKPDPRGELMKHLETDYDLNSISLSTKRIISLCLYKTYTSRMHNCQLNIPVTLYVNQIQPFINDNKPRQQIEVKTLLQLALNVRLEINFPNLSNEKDDQHEELQIDLNKLNDLDYTSILLLNISHSDHSNKRERCLFKGVSTDHNFIYTQASSVLLKTSKFLAKFNVSSLKVFRTLANDIYQDISFTVLFGGNPEQNNLGVVCKNRTYHLRFANAGNFIQTQIKNIFLKYQSDNLANQRQSFKLTLSSDQPAHSIIGKIPSFHELTEISVILEELYSMSKPRAFPISTKCQTSFDIEEEDEIAYYGNEIDANIRHNKKKNIVRDLTQKPIIKIDGDGSIIINRNQSNVENSFLRHHIKGGVRCFNVSRYPYTANYDVVLIRTSITLEWVSPAYQNSFYPNIYSTLEYGSPGEKSSHEFLTSNYPFYEAKTTFTTSLPQRSDNLAVSAFPLIKLIPEDTSYLIKSITRFSIHHVTRLENSSIPQIFWGQKTWKFFQIDEQTGVISIRAQSRNFPTYTNDPVISRNPKSDLRTHTFGILAKIFKGLVDERFGDSNVTAGFWPDSNFLKQNILPVILKVQSPPECPQTKIERPFSINYGTYIFRMRKGKFEGLESFIATQEGKLDFKFDISGNDKKYFSRNQSSYQLLRNTSTDTLSNHFIKPFYELNVTFYDENETTIEIIPIIVTNPIKLNPNQTNKELSEEISTWKSEMDLFGFKRFSYEFSHTYASKRTKLLDVKNEISFKQNLSSKFDSLLLFTSFSASNLPYNPFYVDPVEGVLYLEPKSVFQCEVVCYVRAELKDGSVIPAYTRITVKFNTNPNKWSPLNLTEDYVKLIVPLEKANSGYTIHKLDISTLNTSNLEYSIESGNVHRLFQVNSSGHITIFSNLSSWMYSNVYLFESKYLNTYQLIIKVFDTTDDTAFDYALIDITFDLSANLKVKNNIQGSQIINLTLTKYESELANSGLDSCELIDLETSLNLSPNSYRFEITDPTSLFVIDSITGSLYVPKVKALELSKLLSKNFAFPCPDIKRLDHAFDILTKFFNQTITIRTSIQIYDHVELLRNSGPLFDPRGSRCCDILTVTVNLFVIPDVTISNYLRSHLGNRQLSQRATLWTIISPFPQNLFSITLNASVRLPVSEDPGASNQYLSVGSYVAKSIFLSILKSCRDEDENIKKYNATSPVTFDALVPYLIYEMNASDKYTNLRVNQIDGSIWAIPPPSNKVYHDTFNYPEANAPLEIDVTYQTLNGKDNARLITTIPINTKQVTNSRISCLTKLDLKEAPTKLKENLTIHQPLIGGMIVSNISLAAFHSLYPCDFDDQSNPVTWSLSSGNLSSSQYGSFDLILQTPNHTSIRRPSDNHQHSIIMISRSNHTIVAKETLYYSATLQAKFRDRVIIVIEYQIIVKAIDAHPEFAFDQQLYDIEISENPETNSNILALNTKFRILNINLPLTFAPYVKYQLVNPANYPFVLESNGILKMPNVTIASIQRWNMFVKATCCLPRILNLFEDNRKCHYAYTQILITKLRKLNGNFSDNLPFRLINVSLPSLNFKVSTKLLPLITNDSSKAIIATFFNSPTNELPAHINIAQISQPGNKEWPYQSAAKIEIVSLNGNRDLVYNNLFTFHINASGTLSLKINPDAGKKKDLPLWLGYRLLIVFKNDLSTLSQSTVLINVIIDLIRFNRIHVENYSFQAPYLKSLAHPVYHNVLPNGLCQPFSFDKLNAKIVANDSYVLDINQPNKEGSVNVFNLSLNTRYVKTIGSNHWLDDYWRLDPFSGQIFVKKDYMHLLAYYHPSLQTIAITLPNSDAIFISECYALNVTSFIKSSSFELFQNSHHHFQIFTLNQVKSFYVKIREIWRPLFLTERQILGGRINQRFSLEESDAFVAFHWIANETSPLSWKYDLYSNSFIFSFVELQDLRNIPTPFNLTFTFEIFDVNTNDCLEVTDITFTFQGWFETDSSTTNIKLLNEPNSDEPLYFMPSATKDLQFIFQFRSSGKNQSSTDISFNVDQLNGLRRLQNSFFLNPYNGKLFWIGHYPCDMFNKPFYIINMRVVVSNGYTFDTRNFYLLLDTSELCGTLNILNEPNYLFRSSSNLPSSLNALLEQEFSNHFFLSQHNEPLKSLVRRKREMIKNNLPIFDHRSPEEYFDGTTLSVCTFSYQKNTCVIYLGTKLLAFVNEPSIPIFKLPILNASDYTYSLDHLLTNHSMSRNSLLPYLTINMNGTLLLTAPLYQIPYLGLHIEPFFSFKELIIVTVYNGHQSLGTVSLKFIFSPLLRSVVALNDTRYFIGCQYNMRNVGDDLVFKIPENAPINTLVTILEDAPFQTVPEHVEYAVSNDITINFEYERNIIPPHDDDDDDLKSIVRISSETFVRLTTKLDFEARSRYEYILETTCVINLASDTTISPRMSLVDGTRHASFEARRYCSRKLVILVKDVNDHAPSFFYASDESHVGSTVIQINLLISDLASHTTSHERGKSLAIYKFYAVDLDSPGPNSFVKFTFKNGTTRDGSYHVDETTGNLYFNVTSITLSSDKQDSLIDKLRDLVSSSPHVLEIKASDSGSPSLSSLLTLNIKFLDYTEPTFAKNVLKFRSQEPDATIPNDLDIKSIYDYTRVNDSFNLQNKAATPNETFANSNNKASANLTVFVNNSTTISNLESQVKTFPPALSQCHEILPYSIYKQQHNASALANRTVMRDESVLCTPKNETVIGWNPKKALFISNKNRSPLGINEFGADEGKMLADMVFAVIEMDYSKPLSCSHLSSLKGFISGLFNNSYASTLPLIMGVPKNCKFIDFKNSVRLQNMENNINQHLKTLVYLGLNVYNPTIKAFLARKYILERFLNTNFTKTQYNFNNSLVKLGISNLIILKNICFKSNYNNYEITLIECHIITNDKKVDKLQEILSFNQSPLSLREPFESYAQFVMSQWIPGVSIINHYLPYNLNIGFTFTSLEPHGEVNKLWPRNNFNPSLLFEYDQIYELYVPILTVKLILKYQNYQNHSKDQPLYQNYVISFVKLCSKRSLNFTAILYDDSPNNLFQTVSCQYLLIIHSHIVLPYRAQDGVVNSDILLSDAVNRSNYYTSTMTLPKDNSDEPRSPEYGVYIKSKNLHKGRLTFKMVPLLINEEKFSTKAKTKIRNGRVPLLVSNGEIVKWEIVVGYKFGWEQDVIPEKIKSNLNLFGPTVHTVLPKIRVMNFVGCIKNLDLNEFRPTLAASENAIQRHNYLKNICKHTNTSSVTRSCFNFKFVNVDNSCPGSVNHSGSLEFASTNGSARGHSLSNLDSNSSWLRDLAILNINRYNLTSITSYLCRLTKRLYPGCVCDCINVSANEVDILANTKHNANATTLPQIYDFNVTATEVSTYTSQKLNQQLELATLDPRTESRNLVTWWHHLRPNTKIKYFFTLPCLVLLALTILSTLFYLICKTLFCPNLCPSKSQKYKRKRIIKANHYNSATTQVDDGDDFENTYHESLLDGCNNVCELKLLPCDKGNHKTSELINAYLDPSKNEANYVIRTTSSESGNLFYGLNDKETSKQTCTDCYTLSEQTISENKNNHNGINLCMTQMEERFGKIKTGKNNFSLFQTLNNFKPFQKGKTNISQTPVKLVNFQNNVLLVDDNEIPLPSARSNVNLRLNNNSPIPRDNSFSNKFRGETNKEAENFNSNNNLKPSCNIESDLKTQRITRIKISDDVIEIDRSVSNPSNKRDSVIMERDKQQQLDKISNCNNNLEVGAAGSKVVNCTNSSQKIEIYVSHNAVGLSNNEHKDLNCSDHPRKSSSCKCENNSSIRDQNDISLASQQIVSKNADNIIRSIAREEIKRLSKQFGNLDIFGNGEPLYILPKQDASSRLLANNQIPSEESLDCLGSNESQQHPLIPQRQPIIKTANTYKSNNTAGRCHQLKRIHNDLKLEPHHKYQKLSFKENPTCTKEKICRGFNSINDFQALFRKSSNVGKNLVENSELQFTQKTNKISSNPYMGAESSHKINHPCPSTRCKASSKFVRYSSSFHG